MKEKVSVPFMLLGILFNVCLIAANLLETKVIQVGSLTVTAGLLVFPISYIINDCIAEVWGSWVDSCCHSGCSFLGGRGTFQFCVRYGSPYCGCQSDGFSGRLISQCVCDE